MYHPPSAPKPSIPKPDAPKVSATELTGVAIADTLSVLDQRVQVTVGLRQQRIQSNNYNTVGAVTSAYDDGKTTPLFGAVLKPWEHVAFYYNYLEGLSKGDVAPSNAANAGEIFAPYVSTQQEVGVKLDYGTFMSTLALFQIEKPSGELADGRFSVQGEQRNRGMELNLFGEVAQGTRLLGGVTLLDAQLTRTGIAANRGNAPVGVPDVQANLWAEWDTPSGRGADVHQWRDLYRQPVRQPGQQPNNSIPGPASTSAHVTPRVSHERPTTFRATVQNLFDREYWSGVASYGAFSQGSPRTLLLSATVDF